jgi:hypothetical protein
MLEMSYKITDDFGEHETQWLSRSIADHMDCEGNSEAAVNDALKAYFDSGRWFEWFGDDDNGDCAVWVREPKALAGEYRVFVEKITNVSATRR